MRKRERPAAQATILRKTAKCLAISFGQIQAAFHVGKLPHIVMPAAISWTDWPPAEENVRGALDHPLSDHDAAPLLLDRSFAVEKTRQHGFARFLDLEEQRVIG